ncbi:multiple coagulation factor deficiency protein 2 homolog [Periplaneta americana]|uniref:Uncharacterized protein n=1 Tax=Periplaneta americana TaxID=6978 RepID=A0ABQ8S7X7_PERAM|nr:hypothetical protein ANN_22183 [Periplaneta americana]
MYIVAVIVLYIISIMEMSSAGHQHGMRGPHHPRGKVVTHHHYRPHRPNEQDAMGEVPKLTQDTNLLHDTDHIREDLGEWVSKVDTRKMTPEELEFHYFKLHDFDNNTKLDGLEILQAIHHTVHYNEEQAENDDSHNHQQQTETQTEPHKNTDQDDFNYFVELIDQVLEQDDLDKDGYLSYIEYVVGRQKDENKMQSKYNKP